MKRPDPATEFAWASPCDPKTPTRAARDHLGAYPPFAIQPPMAAIHWMASGYGYHLTAPDIHAARRPAVNTASALDRISELEAWLHRLAANHRLVATQRAELAGNKGLPVARFTADPYVATLISTYDAAVGKLAREAFKNGSASWAKG